MKKPTQRERVLAKLKADGEVSNVWAVQNHIFRLSERIRELKEEDWKIEAEYVEGTKTYSYRLVERPKRTEYRMVEKDGVRMMRAVEV